MITTEQMMDTLMNWRYTFGDVVRIGGVATDAYMTSDWGAIEMAFYARLFRWRGRQTVS